MNVAYKKIFFTCKRKNNFTWVNKKYITEREGEEKYIILFEQLMIAQTFQQILYDGIIKYKTVIFLLSISIHYPYFFADCISMARFSITILYMPFFYLKSSRPMASTLNGIGRFPNNSHAETPFLVLSSENEGNMKIMAIFFSACVHLLHPTATGVVNCTFFSRMCYLWSIITNISYFISMS